MPLLDRYKMPPGGFQYREPSLNWTVPNPGVPFDMVAREIQALRMNNPRAGLNPDLEACRNALDLYTCTRLRNNPKWCTPTPSAQAAMRAAYVAQAAKKCSSCGKKKK